MSESQDVERLVELLHAQRAASGWGAEVLEIRKQCLELVDRYLRTTLRPVLVKRFPHKGLESAPAKQELYSTDAMFRFTDLLQDFFVQVQSKFDDPFWKKDAAIQLRDYASAVISNNIRDALRRRKRQESFDDEQLHDALEEQLVQECEQRLKSEINLELSDVLETLHQWSESTDQQLQELALVLRHSYVSGMTLEQIAADLGISLATAHRRRQEALQRLREKFLRD